MTQLGEAFVPIRATLDKLDGDLAAARGKIDGAIAGIGRATQGLGKVALAGITTGLVAVGGAAVIVGSQLIGLGSDAEEMMGKFNVVFANTGDMVISRLDEFAEAAGRSKYELRGMAATFGDTLKPMGFTEEAAADMAVQLSILATDLGSFNNMPMDEALQRLQGTLIGSHENALAFGVIINENTLAAEMAANGWDTLTGAELEAAKVQARMNLLIKGTTDAQGDAIRTSGSWANQMRALTSTVKDAATELGLKLLPAVTPILQKADELAQNAIPALIAAFENYLLPVIVLVSDTLLGFVSNLQEGMSPLDAFIEAIWDIAPQPVLDALINLRDEIIPGTMAAITAIIDPIAEWIANNIQLSDVLIALVIAIISVVLPAIASVVAAALPIIAVFAALVGAVALVRTAWENNWGGIQEKTQAVIGFVVPLVTNAIQFIRDWWAQNSEAIFAKATEIWNNVLATITAVLDFLWNGVILPIVSGIQAFWAEHGDTILAKASTTWELIKEAISAAITLIQNTIETIVGAIQEFWTNHGEAISTGAEEVWDFIYAVISGVLDTLNAALEVFISLFKGDWEQLGEDLKELWETLWDSVVTILEGLWAMFKPVLDSLWESIKGWWNSIDWAGLGQQIIDGIVAGLTAAGGAISNFLNGLIADAIGGLASLLGIASPSRVMAELIGEPMGEGILAGWRDALLGGDMEASLQMAIAPMAIAAGDDSGPISSVSYTSSTTVNTTADPLRVLRASRHLDALGAML